MTHPKVRALKALSERMTNAVPSGEGHDAWRQIWGQVNRLSEGAQALHNLHSARNPMESDGAHTKRVATAAAKFGKEVEAAIEKVRSVALAGTAEINRRITTKVRLTPDAHAGELRAVWRGLNAEQKTKALNELFEGNHGPELAALLRAPTILTGLSEQHREQYESAFIARHAPDELRERETLADALETALVSSRTAGEVARDFSDPAALAEIARAEAAANAAARTFATTVGGA